uniref:Uncharacterized protein n=1 Tax=Anguilla anguilla TaxID=7936 RepID=A0A0E9QX87_ANGAN
MGSGTVGVTFNVPVNQEV